MGKENKLKRWNWLSDLINSNQFKMGAEVGVASGITTFFLMQNCPSLKLLYAIDIWKDIPNSCWANMNTKEVFMTKAVKYGSRIQTITGVSWEVSTQIKNPLDFVFIDADHSYEAVKKDIKAYTPLLKPNGILSGHDTHSEGVMQAINELIPTWKDTKIDHVWWCKKEDVIYE